MKRFAALLLCAMLLATAAAEGDVPELLEPVGVTMDTATAYIGDLRDTVMIDAYVVPEVLELSFGIDGRIGQINTTIGMEVKKGDVLVTLDHEDVEKAAEQLRDDIAAAEQSAAYDDAIGAIDIEMLELELAQLLSQPVIDQQAVALKELDIREKQLQIEQAARRRDAEMERMRESLTAMEQNLAKGAIIAPEDGRIAAAANFEPGTYVVAFSPVAYLADETKLSVVSKFISTTELKGAKEIYALIGGERYEIVHREMDAQEYASLVLSGASIDITFDFAGEQPENLSAGQYVGVCLVRRMAEDALLVPSNAIFTDDSGRYVYVVRDGERARRYVETGMATAWETQILSGIEEGAVVHVQE